MYYLFHACWQWWHGLRCARGWPAHRTWADIVFHNFTWTIRNFTRFNGKKHYSEGFVIGRFRWCLMIFTKGEQCGPLQFFFLNCQTAGSYWCGETWHSFFHGPQSSMCPEYIAIAKGK